MGQSWMLLNFSKGWGVGGACKLGEIFCHEGLHIHIRHFTIPAWSEKSKESFCLKYPWVAHRSSSPKSKLLRLPNEIISMIFCHVDSLTDAVCLALVDGRMLATGFPRIVKLQAVAYANWAYDRAACIGKYTEDDDFPGKISWTMDAVYEKFTKFQRGMNFAGHFRWESKEYEVYSTRYNYGRDEDPYEELMKPKYESSHPWVLCNLSKKEYVRADAVAALTGSAGDTPFVQNAIRLDHALFSQICWSSDGSISMSYRGDLHRGRWAGDRFVVTSMDKLDPKVTWKDVSDEVTNTLDKIWQSEYDDIPNPEPENDTGTHQSKFKREHMGSWRQQLRQGTLGWWTPGARWC